MKESARAARDEIAHGRLVAALKELAGEDDPNIKELEEVRMRRMAAPVGMMVEREIMADILEKLADGGKSSSSSKEIKSSKKKAG